MHKIPRDLPQTGTSGSLGRDFYPFTISLSQGVVEAHIDCCLYISRWTPNPAPRAKKDSLRIILISPLSADIVLIIHMFDILPRMALRLLLVNVIQALGLEELVDLSARNADEKFLGELMGNGLSCL
jgi:hypothetical protein